MAQTPERRSDARRACAEAGGRLLRKIWQFAKTFVGRVVRDDLASYAAAVTFNLVFAIFPLGLALAGLLSRLHLPTLQRGILRPLGAVVAPEVVRQVGDTILGRGYQAGLSLILGGFAGYVWGMGGAVAELADAFNHAYEIGPPLQRPGWLTRVLAMGLSVALAAGIVLAVVAGTLGQDSLGAFLTAARLPLVPLISAAVQWIVLLALGFGALGVGYWLLPDGRRPFRLITPGSLVGIGVWLSISFGFSLYLAHFNAYGVIYGSFGAVILLFLYLYFLSWALLLGAEVNAVCEARSPRRRQS